MSQISTVLIYKEADVIEPKLNRSFRFSGNVGPKMRPHSYVPTSAEFRFHFMLYMKRQVLVVLKLSIVLEFISIFAEINHSDSFILRHVSEVDSFNDVFEVLLLLLRNLCHL